MLDKTKTIVVIEKHEQTIIRRSRRTVSGQVLTNGVAGSLLKGFVTAEHRAGAEPSERVSVRLILKSLRNLCVLCGSVVNRFRQNPNHRDRREH